MVKSGKELCEVLDIAYNELLEPYFKRGLELYTEYGDFAFDKERIIKEYQEHLYVHKFNNLDAMLQFLER